MKPNRDSYKRTTESMRILRIVTPPIALVFMSGTSISQNEEPMSVGPRSRARDEYGSGMLITPQSLCGDSRWYVQGEDHGGHFALEKIGRFTFWARSIPSRYSRGMGAC